MINRLKPLKPKVFFIRDYVGPQTAAGTHCKARHGECERTKSTGHFSTSCSQGKLLAGSDSKRWAVRRRVQQLTHCRHCFTLLAAYCDQTRLGTLGLPVFRGSGPSPSHSIPRDLCLRTVSRMMAFVDYSALAALDDTALSNDTQASGSVSSRRNQGINSASSWTLDGTGGIAAAGERLTKHARVSADTRDASWISVSWLYQVTTEEASSARSIDRQ
ncbi:BZ3501_MvSof-1269-A2-R1_Chr12-3g03642 [Microbotryum saponariae]|nr:BZ3501_MvSof-1269-A2-R1_Chr12-3g03642 [Microbotryum saponariae]